MDAARSKDHREAFSHRRPNAGNMMLCIIVFYLGIYFILEVKMRCVLCLCYILFIKILAIPDRSYDATIA